jgi:hypothetical protein
VKRSELSTSAEWRKEFAARGPTQKPARAIALAILVHADNRTGEAFPSQTTIARLSGYSVRAVRIWTARLERDGWMLRTRRSGHGRGSMLIGYRLAVPGGSQIEATSGTHAAASQQASTGTQGAASTVATSGTGKHEMRHGEARDAAPSVPTNSRTLRTHRAQPRARPRAGANGAAFDPLSLNPLPEWGMWIAHRREKRWPLTERALRIQARLLAKYPPATQVEMIEASIQAGWQGVFPPKIRAGASPDRVPEKSPAQVSEDMRLAELARRTAERFKAGGTR